MSELENIYKEALAIIDQRGKSYGGIEANFERAAVIASMKLDVYITAYDVAIIMESVKDARRAVDPGNADSHIDGLNYRAFAMVFAPIKDEDEPTLPDPKPEPVKRKVGRPKKAK